MIHMVYLLTLRSSSSKTESTSSKPGGSLETGPLRIGNKRIQYLHSNQRFWIPVDRVGGAISHGEHSLCPHSRRTTGDGLASVGNASGRYGLFRQGFCVGFWLRRLGHLVGLWHDLGKFSDAFQDYLRASSSRAVVLMPARFPVASITRRPGRNMPCVWDRWGGCSPIASRAIMPVSPTMKAANPDCPPACSSKSSRSAPLPIPPESESPLTASIQMSKRWKSRASGIHARLLHAHAVLLSRRRRFSGHGGVRRSGTRALRRRGDRASCAELLDRLNAHLEEKQRTAADTHVNRVRRDVLEACRSQAKLASGLLLAQRSHGRRQDPLLAGVRPVARRGHGLRRVVYAIPFTSIIEQTTDVFREALGDLARKFWSITATCDPTTPPGNPTARDWPPRTSTLRSSSRRMSNSSSRSSPRGPPAAASSTASRRASSSSTRPRPCLPACSPRPSPRSRSW